MADPMFAGNNILSICSKIKAFHLRTAPVPPLRFLVIDVFAGECLDIMGGKIVYVINGHHFLILQPQLHIIIDISTTLLYHIS